MPLLVRPTHSVRLYFPVENDLGSFFRVHQRPVQEGDSEAREDPSCSNDNGALTQSVLVLITLW